MLSGRRWLRSHRDSAPSRCGSAREPPSRPSSSPWPCFRCELERPRRLIPTLSQLPRSTSSIPFKLWGEGLVDVLSANLDGIGTLRAVSPTVVVRRSTGRRADAMSALDLGRRTGAGLATYGRLFVSGADSVRASATLLDVRTGKALAELDVRDLMDRMDRLADSLTMRLWREVGRTRSVAPTKLASLGTTSLPALKAFLQGEQFYRRAEWDSAQAYFERAVAQDSSFAWAVHRLATVVGWGSVGLLTSQPYALRAGQLNHGLAPRESLVIAADSDFEGLIGARGDVWRDLLRRLFATLDEATRRYPDDPEVWYELGEARFHWGTFVGVTAAQMLEAFDRSIALDSAFGPAYDHPVQLGLRLGGVAAFRQRAAAYLNLHPRDSVGIRLIQWLVEPEPSQSANLKRLLDTASAVVLFVPWFNLAAWPDSSESAVRIARLLASGRRGLQPGNEPRLWQVRLAGSLAYRGHLRDARATLSRDSAWKGHFTGPSILADLALLGGTPKDSAAAVFTGLLRAGDTRAVAALPWLGDQRDTVSLREFLQASERRLHSALLPGERGVWRNARESALAYLALIRKDTSEALRRLTNLTDSLCLYCMGERLHRAELLFARGKTQEAAALLKPSLAFTGWFAGVLDPLWTLERARVNERLRNREQAVHDYQFVADVWRNADLELQPYAAEARAALKRFASEPLR